MKLIYIAGPFRAPTLFGLTQNVSSAEQWGLEVALNGHMPVIPHANTWKMYGSAPEEVFLEGTKLLLTKCDGAIFIPGWAVSSGSVGEHELCQDLKIPWLSLSLVDTHERKKVIQDWLLDLK